jgi:putative transposase
MPDNTYTLSGGRVKAMGKLFSKDQIKQFIQENDIKTAKDVQEALKELFGETLQAMLEAEMDNHLGYQKHDDANKKTTNRRNGHTQKTVRSGYGEVELSVPRDRDGEFEPLIVAKRQKSVTGIEEQILALYAKGVSTRDIQDHLHQLYGIDVSPTFISDVTDKVMPLIHEWQSRPLCEVYAVVFLDAIHYKVRCEGHITSKASYMAIGIDLEGKKDVLGMWIGESESSRFWLGVLNEIRNRGTRDILICCTDNLNGFSEAIGAAFPKTDVQKCIVHQMRNSIRYVSYKDVKKVVTALKGVYASPSEGAALEELDRFEDEWGKKYPLIIQSWRNNWPELSTFFKYPPEIRKIIYTTNVIESYHRQLRKVTKGKSIFPSDEALLKMLYLVTQDVMRKWTTRIPHWGQILYQLSVFFPGRINTQL